MSTLHHMSTPNHTSTCPLPNTCPPLNHTNTTNHKLNPNTKNNPYTSNTTKTLVWRVRPDHHLVPTPTKLKMTSLTSTHHNKYCFLTNLIQPPTIKDRISRTHRT